MQSGAVLRHVLIVYLLGLAFFVLYVADPLFSSPRISSPGLAAIYYLLIFNTLLMLLSLWRWVWIPLWLLICLGSALAHYFVSLYGVRINADTLTVFFQATPREVDTFHPYEIVPAILPGVLLGLTGVFGLRKSAMLRFKRDVRAVLMLGIFCVSATVIQWHVLTLLVPYNFLQGSYSYARYTLKIHKRMNNRIDIGNFMEGFENTSPTQEPLKIVLVIGESSRGDHFSLNGYSRETNPLLKTVPNLANFPDARACGIMTHTSVPCLMTRATRRNTAIFFRETSLISAFKALGFNTVWLGAQGSFSRRDPVSYISREADERKMMLSFKDGRRLYDGDLLPLAARYLQAEQNTLMVMHTSGSHFMYTQRYPAEFRKFSPVCLDKRNSRSEKGKGMAKLIFNMTATENTLIRMFVPATHARIRRCAREGKLVNSYDNTILYIDWVLYETIQLLKSQNALFVYVSDHGESLGENGPLMHGNPYEASNWHIPMIWWASDTFIRNNPQAWQAMMQRTSKRVSHDNIFHSLLDCSGVKSALIDQRYSLCRSMD